jgi:acyl-CoA synthetase (AMP-forming)/AMP-acid ligase II
MNILSRFYKYNTRTAICDKYGTYTFGQVNKLAMQVAGKLRPHLENSDVSKRKTFSKQPCVAYFCPRDHTYVASQWASWHAGAIGVPLAENYPADDLRYILEDSGAAVVLSHASCVSALRPAAEKIGTPIVLVDEIGTSVEKDDVVPPPPSDIGEDAMLIYTSGTTGRPKGVLVRHQVRSCILQRCK